jgi:hypothetical protein
VEPERLLGLFFHRKEGPLRRRTLLIAAPAITSIFVIATAIQTNASSSPSDDTPTTIASTAETTSDQTAPTLPDGVILPAGPTLPPTAAAPAVVAAATEGPALPAVAKPGGKPGGKRGLPVDGGFHMGDKVDNRPVKWVNMTSDEAITNPILIPISEDGVVVGFIRSDQMFGGPPPSARAASVAPTMPIVDEAGNAIGAFENGLPEVAGK